jgi:spore coat polysaccharide biosynthesis protein SpsF
VRGHPTDVLTRFVDVLDRTGATAIVRISADSPFIDAETVDTLVDDFGAGGAELVQNHRSPGWPIGTAVEVMTADCLRRLAAQTQDERVREHVTLYAYERPDLFRIRHVPPPPDLAAPILRLCVDTAEDLESARRIWAAFEARSHFTLADVVERFARAGVT